MRIGVALPANQERLHRGALLRIATALDEAGCDSLWVNDHLAAFPMTAEHPYRASPRPDWHPGMPQYEALATCAFLAAATNRARIGVAALVLPQRHPVEVAKTTATLADLSDGRFVLGVGAGWSTREIRLLDREPEGRGALLERQIAVLKGCWGTGPRPAEIPPDAVFAPRPLPGQVPEILVAGVSRAARDRARRCGDGWLPVARDEAGGGCSAGSGAGCGTPGAARCAAC